LAFHHSILERTETKSFGDRSFKGWPPLLLQCHMSCYIAKWAVAGIVAGNLLPVLLPHSLHELAGNLLLHCQMSCGWDCSFPPPLLLELHACCLCWKLGYLLCILFAFAIRCWRIGKAPPPPACFGWKLGEISQPPPAVLAGSCANPPPCLLWLEAGWMNPFAPANACFGWKLGYFPPFCYSHTIWLVFSSFL
jgi:hypothetical protein